MTDCISLVCLSAVAAAGTKTVVTPKQEKSGAGGPTVRALLYSELVCTLADIASGTCMSFYRIAPAADIQVHMTQLLGNEHCDHTCILTDCCHSFFLAPIPYLLRNSYALVLQLAVTMSGTKSVATGTKPEKSVAGAAAVAGKPNNKKMEASMQASKPVSGSASGEGIMTLCCDTDSKI